MSKLTTVLCLVVACVCLVVKGSDSAKTIGVNSKNQEKFGISVTRKSVAWPNGVIEFRVSCVSKFGWESFDSLSLDLVGEKKEFYFRSMVGTVNTNGMARGFFFVHQSKIKECSCSVTYVSVKGDVTVYIVDLTSYTNGEDAE